MCPPHEDRSAQRSPAGDSSSTDAAYLIVLACFFLSGLAALLYQTAWMRQFAVVFGTSELAVATVLAAYMAGLAAGAALVGRFVHRVRRPLFVYGVLEFCIAAGALAVVPGLRAIRSLQIMLIGGQPELPDAGGLAQPLFYVAAAFVVLFIPTACMGATLPLLTRFAVRTDQQLGRRVGVLYAVNTLGAVFGTLGAAFLLLPGLGLFRTTLVGVAANVAIFALAVLLTRSSKNEQSSPSTEPAAVPHSPFATRWTLAHNVLPIMLISGLTSFVYEVLWSRLLGQLIGGSVYAFATMLATFLTGITLGSAVASRLARDRVTSWVGFIAVQVGTAATSVAVFYILDSLPELASRWGASADSSLWASAGLCAIVLLPSTLCIGATFPFAVRLLAGEAKEAGPVSASVYAWNTVGGVCGALLAGFVIVPELEFAGTVKFAALTNLGLAFATAAIFPYFGWFPRAALGVASALMLVGFHPQPPLKLLGTSPIADVNYNGDLMFLRVGRSSTVRMTDGNGYYLLQNNGLPEAIVGLKGTPPFGGGLHRWLTALPLVARPQSESMLVIGFGSGTVVDSLPPSVKDIDVIELEPEVIEANRLVSDKRERDPLSDPRIRIVLNDARGALSLSNRQYNVIVSQPSHPWTAGASHLYTREFMQLAKEHLTKDGVFLQWLSSDFLDEALFRSVGKTLLSVFPNVRLYQPTSTALFFIASDAPLDLERRLAHTGEPLQSYPLSFSHLPINGVNDIAASLVLDTEGLKTLCRSASPNTDDQNQLAFLASAKKCADGGVTLGRLTMPVDCVLSPDSALYQDDEVRRQLSPAVLTHRICVLGQWERALAYAESATEPGQREFLLAIVARSWGRRDEVVPHLRQALVENPNHNDAKFLLCEQHTNEFLQNRVPEDVLQAAQQLEDPARAVFAASLATLRDEFATLESLEPRLAQATPEDYCYPLALYYRAAWRVAPGRRPNRAVLANEALALIDRGMAIWRRNLGYPIRMNAAVMAARPFEAVETARQYTLQLLSSEPTDAVVRDAERHLPVMQRLVSRAAGDPRIPRETIDAIRDSVEEGMQLFLQPQMGINGPASAIAPASYSVIR